MQTLPLHSQTAGLLRRRPDLAEVGPHVFRSWERCFSQYGLEPDGRRETVVVSAESVRTRQQQMGDLLRVARAEMENLYEQIAGSGYAVMLGDADGVVLSAITDPRIKREFHDAGLWVGAVWSEQHEGTNGLGTCIAEGRPVTVYHGEHFKRCHIRLSCSSTPIVDAHGEILAVLDASSSNSADTRLIQRHTMALVNMSANLIARCHFLSQFHDAWVLRFHSRPEFVGLLHEALLAVDAAGTVLAVNDSALLQLGCSARGQLVGRPLESILPLDPTMLEQYAMAEPHSLRPVHDIVNGRRFFVAVRPPVGQTAPALTRTHAGRRPTPVPRPMHCRVGSDTRMQHNLNCGRQLFSRRVPILLQGATGTGKEGFARTLHQGSTWAERPFVAVNCAAIPESLIESELFGYTRGAFTDAAREGHVGKIQQSSGGTLFLDEIGDMPLALQTRLLRVLEEHEIIPLGGDHPIAVDIHLISATHHDLLQMLQASTFREDLYYRLNGITLQLPQLRERTDKRELIDILLREECDAGAAVTIDDAALELLLVHPWPGNIRQLRNVLRSAAALCGDTGVIRRNHLPHDIAAPTDGGLATATAADAHTALYVAERDALIQELERTHWNISRAAQALDISRNTMYRKIHKHDIVLPS